MDLHTLAQKIIDGHRLTRQDDLSFFLSADLDKLTNGADMIRDHLCGPHVDLCSIINAKSGRCPENCRYCAQSTHNPTNCHEYSFLDADTIIKAAKENEAGGVHRFSLVTSGKALTGTDFAMALKVYKRLAAETKLKLCASMGFLTFEQLKELKAAGVTRYHHNIETSRRNFPNICTTHTYDMKLATIKMAHEAGLEVCSGCIIGMGETWEDRIDIAISLFEAGVSSIPINVFMAINGLPIKAGNLCENDIRRTFAIFRYLNPTAYIRLAAGRLKMTNNGELLFKGGANSTITGNMLTTSGATIADDCRMLENIGRTI